MDSHPVVWNRRFISPPGHVGARLQQPLDHLLLFPFNLFIDHFLDGIDLLVIDRLIDHLHQPVVFARVLLQSGRQAVRIVVGSATQRRLVVAKTALRPVLLLPKILSVRQLERLPRKLARRLLITRLHAVEEFLLVLRVELARRLSKLKVLVEP